MKRYLLHFFAILITISFVLPIIANAHSGRTDGSGGHTDHSTGEYHYHHGYSAHDHFDIDGDGDDDCLYEFIDNAISSSSSPSTSSDTTSCTGYHYTYDEIIEYKLENYEDGYDDGYEKGKADGYSQATEELTKKYEDLLQETKERHIGVIFIFCFALAFVSVPMLVVIVEQSKHNKR